MMHGLVNATTHAKKATLSQWCRVLGISRSGWYAARQRQCQPKPASALSTHAKAAFEASGQSYGSRRLSAALKSQGLAVGRHRARMLMRGNGLRARWRRKFVHTTDSRHALPVAPNVLARKFNPCSLHPRMLFLKRRVRVNYCFPVVSLKSLWVQSIKKVIHVFHWHVTGKVV